MKKQIPLPIVIGAIVVVLIVGIFAMTQVGATGPEFEAAPPTGKTPSYVLETMTPEQRAEVEAKEKAAGLDNMTELQQAQQPQQNPYGGR